jgi:hypothetical protein
MNKNNNITSLGLIAIVAALALLGVVAITIVTIPLQQQAEAQGCVAAIFRSQNNSIFGTATAIGNSQGRCLFPP